MKLVDWKREAGLAPDGRCHERVVRGIRQVYVPLEMRGESGWWWALIGEGDEVLSFGWGLGSVRDRNMDLASAMVRFQAREAA